MLNWKNITFLLIGIICLPSCYSRYESYQFPVADPPSRPWTRWWWMGSSVTREGITRHLEAFAEKGMGGVEIVPIYGEKGDEMNFIPYLSDRWIEMLMHTLKEAERLDMQVDLALGSGWPMGGPWIPGKYAARKYSSRKDLEGVPTLQKVKRAAPEAEGWVVDPFSQEAIGFFLHRFDSLIEAIRIMDLPLRAVFNDSYEVYGANWTSYFSEEFRQRRGYDLLTVFPNLLDSLSSGTDPSGWSDYHQTIHELLLEASGFTIRKWCDSQDVQYRYQAHGSPANLLDLYAAAHIPETESFGSSRFSIPGLSYDPDYDVERFAKPDPLIMKFASSPAHISGKDLVSSETGTWLGNHFKVSLAQVKPQVDELFLAGINHILYHGIAYSPFDKSFPGRRFYAATDFGPSSALWPYLDELNHYITNCQSILQHSVSGNDLLVYYPVFDLWEKKGPSGNILMQDVHNPQNWLYGTSFGDIVQDLWDGGFAFDYISDKQLDEINRDLIKLPDSYRVLLIPGTFTLPITTLRNILSLSEKKLKVIFVDRFPSGVPGHHFSLERMDTLITLLNGIGHYPIEKTNRKDLASLLNHCQVHHLDFGKKGLYHLRKKHGNGFIYFISNLGSIHFDQDLEFQEKIESAEYYDPENGIRGFVPVTSKNKTKKIRLQLPPGKSLFLFTYQTRTRGDAWDYVKPAEEGLILDSGWKLFFSDSIGLDLDELVSWTQLPYPWAPYYSGKAIYETSFRIGTVYQEYERFILDLGKVCEMASVSINGRAIERTWHLPHEAVIPSSSLKEENILTIEVANLDANRVIQLDRDHVPWKNFYDINFVDITYQPFDASKWKPLPSGLLGPVRLIPLNN